ncbi:MAG: DUF1080 domain-containing protein [Planctomycetaceae bacterium]
MRLPLMRVSFALAACLVCGIAAADEPTPIIPSERIALFNGKDLDGLYTYLKDTKYEDPRKVFTVENGQLHISGDGLGAILTRKAYRNYHLVVEYKWGERTWGNRTKSTRDSGCLVHCVGDDGAYGGIWPHSIESQIIEGGMGDIILVRGNGPDGKPLPMSLTAEQTKDRDGERIWKKGAPKEAFESGRLNWWGRDPDWKDEIGFRGKEDIDNTLTEWTRMDVICDGGHIQIFIDGVLVNEGFDAVPSAGKILIQTELAELWVRRWDIYPLGKAPKFDAAKK